MPYEDLMYGQRIEVAGKVGVVVECADKYKVKFQDGTFGYFDSNAIAPAIVTTHLKNHKPDQTLYEPTATGTDPLSQPARITGRSIGEPQTVLGKCASEDLFSKA